MLKLETDQERELWTASLLAYINRDRSCANGSHYRFADNVILAFRKRMVGELKDIPALERWRPLDTSPHAFTKMVRESMKESSKIPAIKRLRALANIGLLEAKESVEAVIEVDGKPSNWPVF